jgi:hypothetical protein
MPSPFDDARAQLDAMLAKIDAMLADTRFRRRRGRDDDADSGGIGVREPADRGPVPRAEQTAVDPPAPRYRLDVVGTTGGKATTETCR